MNSSRSVSGSVPAILFFVTCAFWAAIIATGGGILLAWAALASLLSGAFVLARPSSWVTRPLAAASSLFGLTLIAYQLYVSMTLIGTGLISVATYSIAAFVVFLVLYIYLLAASVVKREEEEESGE